VQSPRIIIDDSGVYAINVKGMHEWPEGSAEVLITNACAVAQGLPPGKVADET
jgi:hypothetical protein